MWTTVYRPPGAGPFPLAVISHGSVQNELRRAQFAQPRYVALSEWLVQHGYAVVVPQRPGHGRTGGPYYEGQGSCADADFRKAGLKAADAVMAAIDYMGRQPFVRRDRLVALGQSAGGWASLALASRNPPQLRAVVAFAPGRGGHANNTPGKNCAPERLVAAARAFGRTARAPTLWLYAENDSYFAPALSRRLAEAYRAGGGKAEYHLLPALAGDGHNLISAKDGIPLWKPVLERFFQALK